MGTPAINLSSFLEGQGFKVRQFSPKTGAGYVITGGIPGAQTYTNVQWKSDEAGSLTFMKADEDLYWGF